MSDQASPSLSACRASRRLHIVGRPVGILVTAHGAQALGTTLVGVRSIVHALRGWPTPFAATLDAQTRPLENGMPANKEVAGQLRTVAQQVYEFGCAQLLLRVRMEAAHSNAAFGT
jgi:FMN reductase